MAGRVFEKSGSRNSCEIDDFWSRISIPDEESYDPRGDDCDLRLLPNINGARARQLQNRCRVFDAKLSRGVRYFSVGFATILLLQAQHNMEAWW